MEAAAIELLPGQIRSTRSSDKDEQNVQKLVEKILTNEELLDKLISAIIKRVDEHYNAKLEKPEEKLKVVEKRLEETENAVEAAEQYSRSNNLRIYGLPKTQSENLKICVQSAYYSYCQKFLRE